jgi:signal transduction histidine kinase
MRERAQAIGARLTVESAPNKGTEVRVLMSLQPQALRVAG